MSLTRTNGDLLQTIVTICKGSYSEVLTACVLVGENNDQRLICTHAQSYKYVLIPRSEL